MSLVATYIASAIAQQKKSQDRIAEEIGFDKPNMITMVKQGKTKLPMDRIEATACSLDVDHYELLDLTISEYHPEAWDFIRRTLATVERSRWCR
ncbi:MAG: hypothetical protein Q8L49_09270 [Burkholderiaceae bacterium]|nr:hypothetical protein [Burkholderiaceae bacterium]